MEAKVVPARRGRKRLPCPFSFKCVSGEQCEDERRLDLLSSVFGHSRKVGLPDFRCVRGKRELTIAWLVSFGSVSVTDASALVRCRFLLIRSHVAFVFNHIQNKKKVRDVSVVHVDLEQKDWWHGRHNTGESCPRSITDYLLTSLTAYNFPRHLHGQLTTSIPVFGDTYTRVVM